MERPNVILIMCDQLRADCIGALGNDEVQTPNLDRLVRRGISFSNAYSSCPVCVPARYTIRTGCESYHTGYYEHGAPLREQGHRETVRELCGEYIGEYMTKRGFRTFGIGKFHAHPYNEPMGYEVQYPAEEIWDDEANKNWDSYANFIKTEHPEYRHIEQLHGERTNMYYMPQTSPFPKELTVEGYVADLAAAEIGKEDGRPYFGFVSFIGPHPPLAPPIPYNRMYNPDHLRSPYRAGKKIDTMDETVNKMNYDIWAEDLSDAVARNVKAHYYGEISYIDACLGKILDAVEARKDADNTILCFVSDHGDHMGDHGAWQKESFFEQSVRIPFLLSWPRVLKQNKTSEELVGLADIFSVISTASGEVQVRDGVDILQTLQAGGRTREYLFSFYGLPGTNRFKMMVRDKNFKYVYFANGGKEALFDMRGDARETRLVNRVFAKDLKRLREAALAKCAEEAQLNRALREDGKFIKYPHQTFARSRIKQFDLASGVQDFSR